MSLAALRSLLVAGAVLSRASSEAGPAGRRLSFAMITSYEPGSDVSQHSYIDLDQQEMEAHLGAASGPDFAKAKLIYSSGAHSGAYADVAVGALATALAKGARVRQPGVPAATGYMKAAAAAGATTIRVTYTSTCKEGGTSSPDVSGCFTAAGGSLTVAGASVGSPTAVQNGYRTLAGFSTAAQAKMAGQEYYAVYRAYYNMGDYAHRKVLDALDGAGTCSSCDSPARVEIAKKTSAYMNVWMYVIREMEDAIMDCQSGCLNCNDDPVHAWDEAVAFYSGSLEGPAGSSSGKLLYRLAVKRCGNFGTCGSTGTGVNALIMEQFTRGKNKLLQSKCVEVVPIKRRIVELMSVPLVQGSLRYAYKVDKLQGGSKERAEGDVFSAAVLPRVAACDVGAAQTISDNLAYAATSPMSSGFAAVKAAFESTYACLGVTCEDIGGLIRAGNDHYAGAEPCVTPTGLGAAAASSSSDDGPSTGLIVALVVVGVLVVVASAVAVFFFMRARKYQSLLDQKGGSGAPGITVGKMQDA